MRNDDSANVYKYDGNVEPPAPTMTLSVASGLEDILDLPASQSSSIPQDMLLDTGASVSVVPPGVIAELERIRGDKLPYTLRWVEGINGERQLSRQYTLRVIEETDDCFANKTELRFVVGKKALLGRNFINRYKIVLDGPAMNWRCGTDTD